MKRVILCVALFLGGVVVDMANNHLTGLWISLGWRKPVSDWLVSIGCSKLAGRWGLVWINMPAWATATVMGVVIGFIFRNRKWLAAALAFSIGFIAGPHLLILLLLGVHPFAHFHTGVLAMTLCLELLSLPLLTLAAWLTSRPFRRKKLVAGFPVSAPGP